VLDEIEEFLTGERRTFEPDRVLATVMFTDIVSSTERVASMSDRAWLELLAQASHLGAQGAVAISRGARSRPREMDLSLTFDGPSAGGALRVCDS
jgi:hypothetical protein